MGSGGKMSASAARLSIAGGVRCSAVTAHLSSAPHNWFGSGHTTSLFKIKKKKLKLQFALVRRCCLFESTACINPKITQVLHTAIQLF